MVEKISKEFEMEEGESDNRNRSGSVKAALNLYGEKRFEFYSPMKKPLKDVSEVILVMNFYVPFMLYSLYRLLVFTLIML